MDNKTYLTTTHWGTFRARVKNGLVTKLENFENDLDPSPIGQGILDSLHSPSRILAPMVRESWLSKGPGSNSQLRGKEPFVEVSWEKAEQLIANELQRVTGEHGSKAIYAGSYGWASAGRFHHAQSQLKRFLNCTGGFTGSINSYSFAAAEAMIPHVLGSFKDALNTTTGWRSIVEATELFVAFGGIALKNGQIGNGGFGEHHQRSAMEAAHHAGVQFVNISPLKSDTLSDLKAQWLALRPNSDVALMLGLAHTLYTENLHDTGFLQTYCTGFERFEAYLTGTEDGVAKNAQWASQLCDISANDIQALARKMARSRTMISTSWSLTRQHHGEQPLWMAVTLACMLGQIGKPGGGFGFGYSASNSIGADYPLLSGGTLPQGTNPIDCAIPVARITDMLLNPNASYSFNGEQRTYPDIRLVWWAGGNPYHHHQDLNKLANAWQKPETIIVNDWCWNPTAKRADIVLPCTTHLERDDVGMSERDHYIIRSQKAVDAPGLARNDFDIFRGIARQMNLENEFTQGRDAEQWIRWIYEHTTKRRTTMPSSNPEQHTTRQHNEVTLNLPAWEVFCRQGWHRFDIAEQPRVMLSGYVQDPQGHPLATPSGKIEIHSDTVASFRYEDCPGHPVWQEPFEWLGNASSDELHMISNQPATKLHSQLDQGSISRSGKIREREPMLIHPSDAVDRGINHHDAVRLFNARGACLAVAVVSSDIREGVVQMSTGAWWDPDDDGMCLHGNPNALTADIGTSSLGQGPTAHTCLVRVEKFTGALRPLQAFAPPDCSSLPDESNC